MLTGATTIGRARVTGVAQAERSLPTRLAVAGLLASADLLPPDLPPAAVLIVRRLTLPAQRRLAVQPGARLDPVWERAARDALRDLYRRAARPMHAAPPPDCPAVLFSDEAELLACLALDVSLGRAAQRWWWQAYAKRWGRLAPGVLAALLAERPRSTPAALRILAQRGAASEVLQRLTPGEAWEVLRAVCAAFDVARLALPVATPGRQQPPAAAAPLSVPPGAPARVAPPWQPFTPAGTPFAGLTQPSACLLGVSLTLAHSPSVAQSAAFAAAVERWWQDAADPLRADWQPAADRPAPAAESRQSQIAAPTVALLPAALAESPAPPPDEAVTESPVSDKAGNPVTASSETPLPPPGGHPDAARDGLLISASDIRGRGSSDQPVAPAAPVARPDGVATGLGGVLFLINLMQRLDIPRCFEADWQLASRVGAWGTLDLAARGLLSAELLTFPGVADAEALAGDPLWSALAAIDGRPVDVLPGGAVSVPPWMRVPAGWAPWLGPKPDHAEGDGIASLSLATTASGLMSASGPLLVGVGRELQVWLTVVTPWLRTALKHSLGQEFDIASGLLQRRGQLYVTASHVDLVMPLESVLMPVRIAGLDFDPGWLPAFGRVVRFHYE